MPLGRLQASLRPLKLAFLVNPSDAKGVLQAIQVNTFLWGGNFNPIIPVLKRKPRGWGDATSRRFSATKITEGYIDAFDPDYLVTIGAMSIAGMEVGNRRIITLEDVIAKIKNGVAGYGIGMPDVLQHFAHEELRFVRRTPISIQIMQFDDRYKLFLAAVFGHLPTEWQVQVENILAESSAFQLQTCTIDDYTEHLEHNKLFLRRLTTAYISEGRGRSLRENCVFLMDATNAFDVIDYWNLRATGQTVIPVPLQAADVPTVKQFVENFIRSNHRPSRGNPNYWFGTTLIKARSIDQGSQEAYIQSLDLQTLNPTGGHPLTIRNSYPRIWDEWARDKDLVECCKLSVKSETTEITSEQERVRFRVLTPDFYRGSSSGTPSFANDVDLAFYGHEPNLVAEVIPEGGNEIQRAIGSVAYESWRFSKYGIVYMGHWADWTEEFEIPRAEPVMTAWLEERGWKVSISPPGRVAKQVLKRLGGIYGTYLLANPGVVRLLGEISVGKSYPEPKLRGMVQRIANGDRRSLSAQRLMERLLDSQAVRLGIDVQCQTCTQTSWHSLTDIDYEVNCPRCLETVRLPAHDPKALKWAYTAFGPFRSSDRTMGAFPVLLALRFFSIVLRAATSPLLSFTAKKGDNPLEVDLALLLQPEIYAHLRAAVPPELLFVECKTESHFTRQDTNRMKAIAKAFPGAILGFVTLRETLSEREKALLRSVATQGRRYWKANRPCNPVLILTATELFADFPPRQVWKDKGGKHAKHSEYDWGDNRFINLCDATQQLYLDLPPWHEWLRTRSMRRTISNQ